MKKIILSSFLSLLGIILVFLIFLSTVGIQTDKFNKQISSQVKNFDENIEISLKDVNIIFEPLKFQFNVKTLGTKLKYDEIIIDLESIKSQISLKNIINNKFSLTHLNISTKLLDIGNLISFIRLIEDNSQLFFLEKIIKKGSLVADINLQFDENGKVKENYNIVGFTKDIKINFLKKENLEKIDFIFDFKKDEYLFKDASFLINKQKVSLPNLSAKKIKNQFYIDGNFDNKNFELDPDIFKRFKILGDFQTHLEKINFNSKNRFSFILSRNYKIKNFVLESDIVLNKLLLKNKLIIKKFFPDVKEKIEFLNHRIKISYKKNNIKIEGSGDVFAQDSKDIIKYSIKNQNDIFTFNSSLEIIENPFNLDILNFRKIEGTNLILSVTGKKNKDGTLNFKLISLKEKNNKIEAENLSLSKNFKIKKVKRIDFDYEDIENIRNKFSILKKEKVYILKGSTFNANKLIDEILINKEEEDKNIFAKNFRLKINVTNIFLDKDNRIKNLDGFLYLKDNNISDANLEAFFSKEKKFSFSVKSNNDGKITTLFSANANPIISKYKFIKGYDEGSLDFYSIKKDGKSKSSLRIYDFKLKELPALTKLLTLASLQGIADLLSGEGIRFSEFEMNFENEKSLMKINEIYAIGPAISILMEGYVEKDKLISLRGTLVPATTINKAIGSIPVLGKILVGKKTGEGVFGVSFKIKGPPGKLETSVNPIKTLTPRFITRTLENIKKTRSK